MLVAHKQTVKKDSSRSVWSKKYSMLDYSVDIVYMVYHKEDPAET